MARRASSLNEKNWSSLCKRLMCVQCVDVTCQHSCHDQETVLRTRPVQVVPEVQPADVGGILRWSADPHARAKVEKEMLTASQQTALKRRPGEWGLVMEFDRPTAAGSYAGKHRKGESTLDPKEWELYGKKISPQKSELWARYIGGTNGK